MNVVQSGDFNNITGTFYIIFCYHVDSLFYSLATCKDIHKISMCSRLFAGKCVVSMFFGGIIPMSNLVNLIVEDIIYPFRD